MKKSNYFIVGVVIVFLCLCAIGGAWVALMEKAHAAGDKLEPTARDWQRLNACAQYKPQYQGTTEDVIRCAAIGKGIARFESANGQSRVAKFQNNHYGIMAFPKKGGRYLKTYKTTSLADLDYARIWWKFYRTTKISKMALAWTGEFWIAEKYAKAVKSWYPEYHKMYSEMAK